MTTEIGLPHVSGLRTVTLAGVGLLITVPITLLYLIVIVVVLLSSIPAGCGVNSGMDCTDPDSREAGAVILSVLATAVFAIGTTALLGAVIRRGLRPTGMHVRGARLVALELSLSLIPVVAVGAVLDASTRPDWQLIVPLVLIGGVGAWCSLLRHWSRPCKT